MMEAMAKIERDVDKVVVRVTATLDFKAKG